VNQENSATEQPLAGKETPFLRHLNMKNASFLPRQARDKHSENLKEWRFLRHPDRDDDLVRRAAESRL
jgi:hypothetical protein